MVSQDLDAVWTVLETEPPTTGIAVADIGRCLRAGDVLLGVDADSRRCVLIPLLPGEAAVTDTQGRAVHLVRVVVGSSHFIAIICLKSDLQSVFTQFVRELLDSVADAVSPARAAGQAFERWRNLFSDAARGSQLSEESLVGLLGELMVVERLLGVGAPADLAFWTGPLGHQHDFRSVSQAIEVKSTLVREGRIVQVSSVDQLDAPADVQLTLIHQRFDRDPAGQDLASVVNRLLASGASRKAMGAALLELGIDMDGMEGYASRRFRAIDARAYDVPGEAFPRITRESFAGADVPPGTLRLSYAIDLTNEPPWPLGGDAVEPRLVRLASEAVHGMDS